MGLFKRIYMIVLILCWKHLQACVFCICVYVWVHVCGDSLDELVKRPKRYLVLSDRSKSRERWGKLKWSVRNIIRFLLKKFQEECEQRGQIISIIPRFIMSQIYIVYHRKTTYNVGTNNSVENSNIFIKGILSACFKVYSIIIYLFLQNHACYHCAISTFFFSTRHAHWTSF